MTKPKVAVALQQNQGLHDWITCLMLFYTKTLPVQYNPNRFAIVFLWPSQTKCILLTCLVQQCTDVESARPHRYGGPPTSPQRLAGRVTERLLS